MWQVLWPVVGTWDCLRLTQTLISWSLCLSVDMCPLLSKWPPVSSATLDGAPADPSFTLMHRLKDYRNETMYPNKQSMPWLEEEKCWEKSYLSCQRARSKPEERESFHVGWVVWQKAMPLGLIEIKGGQSPLPAVSIFSWQPKTSLTENPEYGEIQITKKNSGFHSV